MVQGSPLILQNDGYVKNAMQETLLFGRIYAMYTCNSGRLGVVTVYSSSFNYIYAFEHQENHAIPASFSHGSSVVEVYL